MINSVFWKIIFNAWLAVVSASTPPSSDFSTGYYPGYQEMLQQVNQVRASNQLPPLCLSPGLVSSSYQQSAFQASNNTLTHGGPIPFTSRFPAPPGESVLGMAENVGETPNDSVTQVMNAFVADPAHLANILGNYTHFGSAVVPTSDSTAYYWTQHFAYFDPPVASCSGSPATGRSGSASGAQATGRGDRSTLTSPNGSPPTAKPAQPIGGQDGSAATPPPPRQKQSKKRSKSRKQTQSAPRIGSDNVSPGAQSSDPNTICVQGTCYRLIVNQYGTGFIPIALPPNANADAS